MTDPVHRCEKCGQKMRTTHSKKRGGMIDRRRQCVCGYVDRVLLKLEVVRILEVTHVLKTHTNPIHKPIPTRKMKGRRKPC